MALVKELKSVAIHIGCRTLKSFCRGCRTDGARVRRVTTFPTVFSFSFSFTGSSGACRCFLFNDGERGGGRHRRQQAASPLLPRLIVAEHARDGRSALLCAIAAPPALSLVRFYLSLASPAIRKRLENVEKFFSIVTFLSVNVEITVNAKHTTSLQQVTI